MPKGDGTKHCVDLFSGLGGFSQAFEAADGWGVTSVDIQGRFNPDVQSDVMDLDPAGPDPDVVLASPPCVDFSVACITDKWDYDEYRRPFHLPRKEQIAESIALVFRTLWLIHEWNPDYWYLENPQGMLNVWLNEPVAQVDYCAYGSEYKKPTQLWGHHPPMEYRSCPGPKCDHKRVDGELPDTLRDDDSAASADSDDAPTYRCVECQTTVPADDRERHARETHKAPPDMTDTLFEEVDGDG